MRIAVLGGGPGGYSAAFEAARLGAEVTLVEKARLGGTCLNWGCIPTKTILRSAHIVADARHAGDVRARAAACRRSTSTVLRARKEGVVDELVGQIEATGQAAQGRGRATATVRMTGAQAAHGRDRRRPTVTIDADAIILATGSVPFLLPNIDHSLPGVWTSDEATALSAIPGASRHHRRRRDRPGVRRRVRRTSARACDVVELTPTVLPGNDKRVQREAQKALEALGVRFHLGAAVEKVEQCGARSSRDARQRLRCSTADIVLSRARSQAVLGRASASRRPASRWTARPSRSTSSTARTSPASTRSAT